MKIASLLTTLLCLTLISSGCASHKSPLSVGAKAESGDRQGLGFDINTNCSLIVGRQVSWWPSSDYHGTVLHSGSYGYVLHAGTYKPECEDAEGIFFKGPAGLDLESVDGKESVKGGIYLPKTDATGIRGHVYLWKPGWGGGWMSFMLPDEFFTGYGNTWVLVNPDGQHLPPPRPMPGVH